MVVVVEKPKQQHTKHNMARPRLGYVEQWQRQKEKEERIAAEKEIKQQLRFESKAYAKTAELKAENEMRKRRADFIAENKIRKKYGLSEKYDKSIGFAKPLSAGDYVRYFNKPEKKRSPSFAGSLRKEFKGIARAMPRQVQTPIDVRRVIEAQRIRRQQMKPRRKNFFEHGSELEVYGDEGLTFFDGEKRAADETGSLFGLY